MSLRISESFVAPQGEGYMAGIMTLFVRVAGCNFYLDNPSHPCAYCDTGYAWNLSKGKEMTLDEVAQNIDIICMQYGLNHVSFTGGEPLIYEDIKELIYWKSRKYNLTVETNGSISIWKSHCIWSMDIKTSGSGNSQYNRYENIDLLEAKDQLKFVICDQDDFEFARSIVRPRFILANIVFQPSWKQVSHKDLIGWVKNDKDLAGKVRIGGQYHKYWYPGRKKGV